MRTIISLSFLFINFHLFSQEAKDILKTSIAELEKIQSFKYTEIFRGTSAYDTTNFVREFHSKVIGVKNETDSVVGCSYLSYWRDTSKLYSIYDFEFDVTLNWYDSSAEITNYRKFPNKRQSQLAPFIITARTLFDFAINGEQAEITTKQHKEDCFVIDIHFKENRFEFFTNRVSEQGTAGSSSSLFTVWIDKHSNLPFKIHRKQVHEATIIEIINLQIDSMESEINALEYIPESFTIIEAGMNEKKGNLPGKPAPEFTLLSTNNDSISLSDFRGNVVLLEFSSVSCGPCHLAMEDLIDLSEEYKHKRFSILSIETYLLEKETAVKKYVEKNNINYPFLLGQNEITNQYHVPGVPFFVLVDQEGIIRSATLGFSQNKTIKELREKINSYID